MVCAEWFVDSPAVVVSAQGFHSAATRRLVSFCCEQLIVVIAVSKTNIIAMPFRGLQAIPSDACAVQTAETVLALEADLVSFTTSFMRKAADLCPLRDDGSTQACLKFSVASRQPDPQFTDPKP